MTQYLNNTITITIHVHCSVNTLKKIRRHTAKTYSPKQCLSSERGQLMELTTLLNNFKSYIFSNASQDIIIAHIDIIEQVEDGKFNTSNYTKNKKSSQQLSPNYSFRVPSLVINTYKTFEPYLENKTLLNIYAPRTIGHQTSST
jgi:hypothetical protein